MITAILRGALDSFMSFQTEISKENTDKLVNHLDTVLKSTSGDKTMVLGAFLLLDFRSGEVHQIGCGLNPSIYYDKSRRPNRWTCAGDPLGLVKGKAENSHKSAKMESGARIILYTDGCFEFLNDGNRCNGRKKLFREVDKNASKSAIDLRNDVQNFLRKERSLELPDDDNTLIIVDIK